MKTINIQKPCYALASKNGKDAELTLYGDIYEERPVDPWTGRPKEGKFILLNEFLNDLESVEGYKSLTVRMNSYGGDAGVSNTIHNRLRELSRNGVKTTCIVDGVAMSGGSLIMCGCDTVQANPSSLIMIHKAWTFLFGGYNADEMREVATKNDAWDKMQSEIYQRKTGLSNAVILHMMADTTYMTGREAKEKGFVDELLEDAEPAQIAASADGRSLFVRGHQMHLAPGMFAPDNIPTADPEEAAASSTVNPTEAEAPAVETNINTPVDPGNEGGNPMTLEEIRAQQPELVQQIEASAAQTAVQNERTRLQGIDEVAALFPAELVAEAKYGEHPCSASELALKAAKAAAKAGSKFLSDLSDDAKASGSGDVTPAPAPDDEQQPATNASKEADGYAMAQKLNEMK